MPLSRAMRPRRGPDTSMAVMVAVLVLTAAGAQAQSGAPRRLDLASPAALAAAEALWPPSQQSPTLPTGPRAGPVKRQVLFGVIGAVAGLFVGGALGARIGGNSCACDDPGLQGWMIGAPIGGIVGGYLGVKVARR